MNIIADCGSTKIDWMISGQNRCLNSPGINATLLSSEELSRRLAGEMPAEIRRCEPEKLFFYAAGCRTDSQCGAISEALAALFPAAEIHVGSDLLGAARALCGHEDGIACILGTGSNCCRYSPLHGGEIVTGIPPLGYVLGDEGSGNAIGRRLVADALKGIMPTQLRQLLLDHDPSARTPDQIIDRVYRGEAPNRFLASYAKFAAAHIGDPYIEAVVTETIDMFFTRCVTRLPECRQLPVSFTGSVASAFQPIVRSLAGRYGLTIARFVPRPIDSLANFHDK